MDSSRDPFQEQIREAIVTELTRQSELSDSDLSCKAEEGRLTVHGTVDLDALALVIAGSLAGGP